MLSREFRVDTSANLAETDELAGRLARFLDHEFGVSGMRISNLARRSTGMSRENWTFTAHCQQRHGRPLDLILRRDPRGSMLETDRRSEHAVLSALRARGLPVPELYGADFTGEWLGRPSLIMQIVAGECDYFAVTGARPLSTRLRLANDFLDLLARIQEVDWRSLGLHETLSEPGDSPSLHELDRWSDELRRVQLEPMPEMQVIASWLRSKARPARRIVLVHGDFKPGNALILDHQISAMLDWETAHLGDPLEDLGWITNPARSGEYLIEGSWGRREIIAGFERRTGYAVDDDELHWWNVFACWKLAIIILTGIHALVEHRLDQIHHDPTFLYRRMLKMIQA
jgi:aminoglycoside phosphotransferase (APT) family kinase protein